MSENDCKSCKKCDPDFKKKQRIKENAKMAMKELSAVLAEKYGNYLAVTPDHGAGSPNEVLSIKRIVTRFASAYGIIMTCDGARCLTTTSRMHKEMVALYDEYPIIALIKLNNTKVRPLTYVERFGHLY
jgi:2-C-methyl-D-erythritol 4-phosphate cytidylyltransferase